MSRVRHRLPSWAALASLIAAPLLFVFNSCESSQFLGDALRSSRQCSAGKLSADQQKLARLHSPSVFAHKKLVLREAGDNSSATGKLAAPGESVVAKGTALVALMDTTCLAERAVDPQFQQSWSGQIMEGHPIRSHLRRQAVAFELAARFTEQELEAELTNAPCLVGVGANHQYRPSNLPTLFNDPGVLNQNHLVTLKLAGGFADFFSEGFGILPNESNPIRVAVVDTGVAYTHTDLQSSIWRHGTNQSLWGYNATSMNSPSPDYNPQDVSPQGHGTHVSGLVAAAANNQMGVVGTAPYGVQIMAIKVFREENGELTSNSGFVYEGIEWAIANGANVINLSLTQTQEGTPNAVTDAIFDEVVRTAIEAGIVVVAAAGNGSPSGRELTDMTFNTLPGKLGQKFAGMLNVGSVTIDQQGQVLEFSSFSHYSSKYVEIAAPGMSATHGGVYSTKRPTTENPNGSYGYMAGTSQSTPQVAAAAAMAMGLYRRNVGRLPSPAEVERLLISSAQKDSRFTTKVKSGSLLDLQSLAATMHAEHPEWKGGEPLPACP